MIDEIKLFIEKNIDRIQGNDQGYVYSTAIKELQHIDPDLVGDFTQALESAEVCPLEHLTYIPSYYLMSATIHSYVIPDTIENIHYYAFLDCRQLETVIIPKSVTILGSNCFNACENLEQIIYEGTIKDWEKIIFTDKKYPLGLNRKVKIKCSDGEIEV